MEQNNTTKYEIKPFDRKTLLEDYFRMAVLGSSSSGKTYYVKELLKILCNYYNRVFIFTQEHNKEEYEAILKPFMDKINKYKSKNLDIDIGELTKNDESDANNYKLIKNAIKKLQKVFNFTIFTGFDFNESVSMIDTIKLSNKLYLTSTSKKNFGRQIDITPYNILIILDDIITNKSTKNDTFLKIISNCRHNHMSIIYLSQYLSAPYINDGLKNNMSHLVFTKPQSKDSRLMIKRDFIGPTVDTLLEDNDNNEQIKETRDKIFKEVFSEKYAKLIYITKDSSIYIDI